MTMNSRERVLRAIDHKESPRIPIFGPNLISTYAPLDPRVQHLFDTFPLDCFESLGFIESPSRRRELPGELFEDGYGCRYQYKGVGLPYCVHRPLAEAETVADVEHFPWPDPEAPGLLQADARQRAREIRAASPYATIVHVDMLFHQYTYLRGFDQWLLDLKLNPKLHRAIADRLHHINVTLAMRLLDQVGEFTDIVATGDDLGHSTGPFMSPDDFRAQIKPYFQDLIGRVKSRCPHVKFYLHCHGQVMDLVPDLIDCGVDILNPILPLDNMDAGMLKREYGNLLSFQGGIDIEHVLPFGTVAEVETHVRHVLDLMTPGGGYMFKAQAISPVIPYENLSAAYNLALEYSPRG
jgi:uroporphyrinogen decarboxylase